jgi:adrenodoxin-NADP+ reductase
VKSGSSSASQVSQNKQFSLDFLLGPIQFNESSETSGELGSIDFQQNKYTDETTLSDPRAAVTPSSDSSPIRLQASAAFRSIGYKAEPLPSLSTIGVPFDHQRGLILNQLGRILSPSNPGVGIDVTPPLPGLYVAGWAKRGPTGVIASTMEDAFGTADCIIGDLEAGMPFLNHDAEGSSGLGWEGVRKDVEQPGKEGELRRTSWRDWEVIDRIERERGRDFGKEREKITSVEEMLRVLDG